MLNTYIKNRGLTQTLVHTNNRNHFNETNWDADYDGDIANISVTSNMDGNKNTYNVTLDNEDLANILNVPSISMPIDKRLQMDFAQTQLNDPRILQIEIPELNAPANFNKQPYLINAPNSFINGMSKSDDLESDIHNSFLSSPLPNEELIVPITIDEKTLDKYTLTPHRRHRRKKTHKTYKVYKKPKSTRSSKTKVKSKTKSKKSKKIAPSISLF
jgi:hypothetical protein